jgi:type I restriction enzyme S subunit
MEKDRKKGPEVRFKGFTDEWEQRKVLDLSEKTLGGGTPKTSIKEYWNGDIPWIQSSDLQEHRVSGAVAKKKITKAGLTNSAAKIVQKGSIAIVTRVGFGKIALMSFDYTTSQDFLSLVNLKVNDWFGVYSLYTRLQKELNNVQGTSIKGITKKELLNTKIYIPRSIENQTEIGNFFKQLDNIIALHQQKLDKLKQLKKGFMQVMFPQKGELVPRLRFAGFDGEWRQRKLGEMSERVRGNDGRMDLPTLTISAGSGWLDQRERFSGNIAGKEQKNYTLLSKGELSYNHGNSKLAKYGAVFELRTYEEALVPRVYHSFKTNKEASPDFIEYMFATKIPDRELAKLVSSGARMDGLLNINYDEFMSIKVTIPKIKDQMKIAKFLRKLDDSIALHQSRLDKLKTLKKVFLKKMFI